MATPERKWQRKGFYEAMAFTRLADQPREGGGLRKRFMSLSPAWKPGRELPWDTLPQAISLSMKPMEPSAFGGHVYAQSALVAGRAVEEGEQDLPAAAKRVIHVSFISCNVVNVDPKQSIQGVFSNPGLIDRPFVYEVSEISSGRSFSTSQVISRQPAAASAKPLGPFPASDADVPLSEICFSCLVTFKRAFQGVSEVQTTPPQVRYAAVLASRNPWEWMPSPQVDIDMLRDLFPNADHGAFPMLDMYKVDMSEINKDKPVLDRRELLLYKLLEPIPKEDINAHIVCHAYEADRNGLLMIGNQLGYGYNLGTAASLSYSFYVHVNGEQAVMDEGWWIQEVSFSRVSAGRAMLETKIWSPTGLHVASGYQDGIITPRRGAKSEKL
ncbi:hypothetical protein S40293_04820 [Stachybotrys chartarum IBT 40293]|nr:hypothetical protein S40293_04820 [Stachybotrys chartarum IBT 40293]